MIVEKSHSPKFDWRGDAYRWRCEDHPSPRRGTWESFPGRAERAGRDHDRQCHGGREK